MKDGKLDLALIPDELKNLLSKQESEEKIISQKTEQRDLTFKEWKELVKITKKYGFSWHFDYNKETSYMKREWENDGPFWKRYSDYVRFEPDCCYIGFRHRFSYNELRNNSEINNESSLREFIRNHTGPQAPLSIWDDLIAVIMEVKNLLK